jgi:hypothetical protein
VFTLVSDADGFLRIRSIGEEVIPVIEGATWGRVKARYRSPGPDIPVDLTFPLHVIESHARAINHRSLATYAALLDPGFEYVVPSDEIADIPWLNGDSWDVADELDIITNMMNPDFQGPWPPVRVMRFAYTWLREDVQDTGVVITVDADAIVLASSSGGWFTRTRLDFLLAPDADGFYRIREIREIEVLVPDGESWAVIKARYR